MNNLKNLCFLAAMFICINLNAQKVKISNLSAESLKKAVKFDSRTSAKQGAISFNIEGHTMDLLIKPNDLMSSEFTKAYPSIKTYNLYSSHNPELLGSMTLSDETTTIFIHTPHGYKYISNDEDSGGMFYNESHTEKFMCGVHETKHSHDNLTGLTPEKRLNVLENGSFKRRYRMAIVTTGEFYTMNGNSNSAVTAVVTASVNALQLIYDRELAVNFTLLTPSHNRNANSDPFTPDQNAGADDRVTQAENAVTNAFNVNQYDIGHVLHQTVSGDNWSSGGLAFLGVVCNVRNNGEVVKAGGWSSSFDIQNFNFIHIFAHEVAHMFGAQHTFNGRGESCDDAISEETAYEIGSGTTLMSYNGICDESQNIASDEENDDYFHVHSLSQMVEYMESGGDCATEVQTNNSVPQADANPCGLSIIIPKRTAFYLQGSATDADTDDVLTYNWEQYDEDGPGTLTQGFIGVTAASNRQAPLFKSVRPSSDSIRYFPDYDEYVSGTRNDFDVLSRVARDINFRFTVRDNNPDGGAIASDALTIQVDNTGPLEVTSPDGREIINAGDDFPITWDNNGSEALCDLVNIELSIDGGFTFPIRIASNVNYDDQEYPYTFPPGLNGTEDARIKITCIDSDCTQFYDLSDRAFEITSTCTPNRSSICDEEAISADQGSPQLQLNLTSTTGETGSEFRGTILSSSPESQLAIFGSGGTSCAVIIQRRRSVSYTIAVGRDGIYNFDMDHNFQGNTSFFSLFDEATYNPNSSCSSLVTSSGTQSSPGSNSAFSNNPSAFLESCKEYRIVFWSFALSPASFRMNSVTGPGRVYINKISDPDFGYTYIAVNNTTNQIEAFDNTGNFMDIAPGTYSVYGMSYGNSPTALDLNTILGNSIVDLAIKGDCVQLSENFKEITVQTSCFIRDITAGAQSVCDPNTNTFSQDLLITYELEPENAMLLVNGQTFPVTGSPQTITLVGLESDGSIIDVEAVFSNDMFCRRAVSEIITAPENCCPFDITIGDDRIVCIGQEDVLLNAGAGGATYQWSKDGSPLLDTGNELEVLESGLYSVLVTSAMGCAKEESVMISFLEVPTLDAIPGAVLCGDESYEFSVETDGINVEILRDNMSIDSNQSSYTVEETGSYTVISTNDGGCQTETVFEVTVNTLPTLELGDDIEACESDEVTLDAGEDGISYEWLAVGEGTLPDESSTIIATSSTQYIVTVTSAADCTSTDAIDVTFLPAPTLDFISVTDTVTFCSADPGEITLEINDPQEEVAWTLNGTGFDPNSDLSHTSSEGGLYEVSSSNIIGCTTTDQVEVIMLESPIVNLGDDIIVCDTDEVILDAGEDGERYEWFIAGTGTLPEDSSTIIAALSTEYSVTVTSENECSAMDVINVELLPAPTLDFVGLTDTVYFCSLNPGEVVLEINDPGEEVSWTLDGTDFDPNADFSHTSSVGGLYEVSSSNSIGCTTTDQVQAIIIETPVTDLGDDLVACVDSEITLLADIQADDYEWSNMGSTDILSTTDELIVTEPGTFVLTTTNQGLCSSEEEIVVDFVPGPTLEVSDNIEICQGESNMITATTNGDNIQWFRDTQIINGADDFELEVSESGEYMALVLGDSDCEITASVTVTVFDLPEVNLDGDQSICTNENYALIGDTGNPSDTYAYLYNGDDLGVPNGTTMIDIDAEGTYEVIVTNSNGCTDSETMTLNVNPLPTADISGSSTLCVGASGELEVVSNGSSFQWSLNNNPIGTNSSMLSIDQEGTYTVESTSTDGCSSTDMFEVESVESPTLDLIDNIELCPGETMTIDAGSHTTYTWSTGESSSTIEVTSPDPTEITTQTINVIVANSATCISTDDVIVTFAPIITGDVVKSAEGICPDAGLTLEAIGGLYYQWDNSDNTLSASDEATVEAMPVTTTSYEVTITDDCPNNEAVVTVEVPVFEGLNITAGPDTCIVIGQTYEMQASGGVAYDWDNESTIVGSDLLDNTEVEPTETTIYTVEVTDANGCVYEDAVEICIVDDPLSVFKAISIITPNDDGMNDDLIFPGLDLYETNELVIFNRWGNVIFEAIDYQLYGNLFNGTSDGEKLSPDTYFYVLKFDGNVFKSSITIVYQ